MGVEYAWRLSIGISELAPRRTVCVCVCVCVLVCVCVCVCVCVDR
jgi:hypothetical protein